MEMERTLFALEEVARRWGVSVWTVRRLLDDPHCPLKAINIGARRLVPLRLIEQAEASGIGMARKRKAPEVTE